MRNFLKLAEGIDMVPSQLSLAQTDLWNQFTLRTATEGSPHRELDDIWLRMNDLDKCRQAGATGAFIDHRESVNYPAWGELQYIRKLVMNLFAMVEGERLGRVLISRLPPGRRILPHKDIGDDLTRYYDNEPYYSRFHLCVQGLPGSIFNCEDETVQMRTGEAWWFRNDLEHEVINNSADDRIHVVIDIRTPRYADIRR